MDIVSATLAASELPLNKFHTSNTSAPPRPSILVFERSSTAHGPAKIPRRAPPRGRILNDRSSSHERTAGTRILDAALHPHVHLRRLRRHGIRAPTRRGGHEGAARRMAHKRGAQLRFRRHPHAGRSEPRTVRPDRRGALAQPLEPAARAQPNGRRPVRRHRQDAGPCSQRRCSRGPR